MANQFTSVSPLNSEVVKDVIDLNKKIEEEKKKDNPDNKELEKLYMQQLYRGMMINTGILGNYRDTRPY